MSIQSYIQSMPKVDLHVHLDGGASREAVLIIADQNEIVESLKHFSTWTGLLDKPDFDRLDDLLKVTSNWIRLPEDVTRIAYDLATHLAKQNVRYAEVTVNPSAYVDLNIPVEQFVVALNDGRDRAHRASRHHRAPRSAVVRASGRRRYRGSTGISTPVTLRRRQTRATHPASTSSGAPRAWGNASGYRRGPRPAVGRRRASSGTSSGRDTVGGVCATAPSGPAAYRAQ